MRIGVLTDLHVTDHPLGDGFWHGPFDFAGVTERTRRGVELLNDAGVDLVAVLGDLSDAGDPADDGRARALLEDAGPPVILLPGNHDVRHGPRGPDGDASPASGAAGLAPVDGGIDVVLPALDGHGPDPVVLLTHFPVLARAEAYAALGLRHSGDLHNRAEAEAALQALDRPVVVVCGHLHLRETSAAGHILQVVCGPLIEAPHDVTVVEIDGRTVRRRVVAGEPFAGPGPSPVLAPEDETWRWDGATWAAVSRRGPAKAPRA
jgi:predicted phosphodiesterase